MSGSENRRSVIQQVSRQRKEPHWQPLPHGRGSASGCKYGIWFSRRTPQQAIPEIFRSLPGGKSAKGGTYEIEDPDIQISEIAEHYNIEKARVPRWGGEPWK